MESRIIHDPFIGKDVEISNRLTDRLRGRYACGPTMANGEPEFGWREFETPPIQHEAAAEIERLITLLSEARQYVSDAGGDEDPEAQRFSIELLYRIDAVLGAR